MPVSQLKLPLIIIIAINLSLFSNSLYSQSSVETDVLNKNKTDSIRHNIDYLRLGIASGITAAALTYSFLDQYREYWRNNGKFHIMTLRNEYDDALLADKYGHLYITFAATRTYKYAFEWIGMDSIQSIWWSAAVAMAHQTFTELQDGFSHGQPYLGFSFGDYFANIAGAGYAVLQEYKPFFRNFDFKVSLSQRNLFSPKEHNSILQDYESRFNWISVNIYNLLPEEMKKYYPPFVNLAAGFIVKDINRFGSGEHELYIALDWVIPDEIVKDKHSENIFTRLLKNVLNLYHFPAPAVKIYPDVVWYGLLF